METVVPIRDDGEGSSSVVMKMKKPSLLSSLQTKLGREDQRRVVHSVKVGIALVLVSLLYLVQSLYDRVGDNAMWAIMTVVVVFEFSAGATLSKGLNRGMGTIVGGGLGCSAALFAREVNLITRALAIGTFVFLFGAAATYARMVPSIKKKYDYGAMIFILTFNLVAVSGFRGEEIIKLTSDRLLTILIGFVLCICTSLFFFPVWASDDLHRSLVTKFGDLSHSIEECLEEFFKPIDEKTETEMRVNTSKCTTVLYSKSTDETLARFAKWEPWHGKFGFSYPWDKYLEIGELLRELAASIFTLKGHLNSHRQLSPLRSRMAIKEACEALGALLSSTLADLGDNISNMKKCRGMKESVLSKLQSTKPHLCSAMSDHSKLVKMEDGEAGSICNGYVVSFIFAWLDMVDKVEALAKEVEELGDLAGFRPQ